jgi:hypothetical protein
LHIGAVNSNRFHEASRQACFSPPSFVGYFAGNNLTILYLCHPSSYNEKRKLKYLGEVFLVTYHNDIELYRCLSTDKIQDPLFVGVLS